MPMDVVLLSRIQFALTIMFHYIFPPLTIGLSVLMVIMEGLYLKTRQPVYEQMARFWTKIFAVNFAMGVATGIVMEFQFGTNWSGYSKFVGDVFGSALAAEGIFAFFLESGFLSVLVFGWDRVSAKVHFLSTFFVALGSVFSAIWIVVANSWQQTPAGYKLVTLNGFTRCEITDFWAVVFNASSMPRLSHTLSGALVLGAFFVMSVSAFYLLRGHYLDFAKRCMTIGLVVAFVSSVWAALAGDTQARTVAFTQPEKLAAFEGHYHTESGGTGLYAFGIPNPKAKRVDFGVQIPGMLSFLVYGNPNKPVAALDSFPEDAQPPVPIPFFCFHLMVMLGTYFVALTSLGLLMLWRKKLFETRWLLWTFVFSVIGPFVANEVGWTAAEVGRQPWIVYHLLRTKDGASLNIPGEHIIVGIIAFALIYVLLAMVWVNVLHTKIVHGPEFDVVPSDHAGGDEPLLGAAAHYANPSGPSLTTARNVPPADDESDSGLPDNTSGGQP
jgi:cytochrome d ubiquinol oxidase subunit I